jgi:hypothetical protein
MKTGRNDPCPCGSGRKFKKCCLTKAAPGNLPSTAQTQAVLKFALEVKRREAEEHARVEKFGKVRAEIATENFGRTLVAVGSKIHWSEEGKGWITFPDFLLDYMAHMFGKEWGDPELKKPFGERHPVVQWRCKTIEHIKKFSKVPGQATGFTPNNFLAAFNSFAYDLYTVDHNGRLDGSLLERLKNKAEFEGARHELCAEATCLGAGFKIEHENQRDTRIRHAEFLATHEATGQKIAVEAKRRRRETGKPFDFRFEHLINSAIKKNLADPLVIFLDTNLPTVVAEQFFGKDGNQVSKPMKSVIDRVRQRHGGMDPYNMIVFTNHPHSLATEEGLPPTGFALSCISMVPQRPAVNTSALLELDKAAQLYYNVPNELSISQTPDTPSSQSARFS